MYTVIVGLAIAILIAVPITAEFSEDKPGRTVLVFCFTVFGGMMGMIIASLIGDQSPRIVSEEQSFKLAAIRAADGSDRVLLWGPGTAGDTYHVMRKKADGSLSPWFHEVDESVHVIEDGSLTGEGLLVVRADIPDPVWPYRPWALSYRHPRYTYEIHVPSRPGL